MKFSKYFMDKIFSFFIISFNYFIILMILFAFKIDKLIIIVISIMLIVTYVLVLLLEYYRKRNFYNDLVSNIEKLDKAYLVLEMINTPEFYEGKIIYQALYDINKSMNDNIKSKIIQLDDFKEYVEMWIHEVKIPLASLVLQLNNNDTSSSKTKNTLKRLEDYVDQVLYYVRSENAEEDYYIKEVDLSKVIKSVSLKNMDDLLDRKINYNVSNVNYKVYTDSKWLEFILNQIINNSIKYKKNSKNDYINIYVDDYNEKLVLVIEDNGIGIPSCDIKQVFNKTFTGSNGRDKNTSTGMGLYIAKNLCKKLGHLIDIESIEGKYTKVYITFSKNKYYDVLK